MATVPCQYKTGRTLGQGTYAVVKEAVHIKTGQYYACKVINKRLMEGREHMIRNEIAVLKTISQGHKNIVTLWDYFETQNNLYLVTDLCQGGELFDRICAKQYFHEHDAAKLVQTVVSAVAYLHGHGIVHRDLKPENLLFRTKDDDSDLLIADFGLSKIVDEGTFSALTTTCGTPGYMAPEIFKKQGHGKPVDLWAVGVITYFLLCGYTPFDRDSQVDEIQAICAADYAFEPAEYWEGISQTAREFIGKCLTIDQAKRITAADALAHPWLQISDAAPAPASDQQQNHDLLPTLRRQFDPAKTFRKAIFTVRAAAALQDGGRRQRQMTMRGAQTEEQKAFAASVEKMREDAETESSNVTEVLAP
ncbi:BZ3500_MvSof-1268-A1-R1_Chr8-2g10149 [Microbotryum saponariae]|uniref:BZ3500_MvSof-1268-A1-R1_Chr8-2g10149 protein n=1 Tax=Microbotryum saponariae TaxID=289078 RepID=A0A2X0MPX4_9BASI|nr:BZ3500_MvSof-1268-A1-R1_Chr8-2g10149 [Microbotryum saponariae]SDA01880.1 BZ3501_MvSof-1269-A2-R1_Chr8-2g09900 [Microbotryum saponariae]